MTKQEARKEYGRRRLALTAEARANMEVAMLSKFSSMDMGRCRTLMSYYPLPERNEFNVKKCEALMRENNDNLRIAWPRLRNDLDSHNEIASGRDMIAMDAVIVHQGDPLLPNRFNIPEPTGDGIVSPEEIDLVFVPLLAFDMHGYRVGYGKGYYDRFLVQCRKDLIKAGFSYFEPIDRIDDIGEFDVPLTLCITPSRIYEF